MTNMPNAIDQTLRRLLPGLKQLRHELHIQPELSMQELHTSRRVKDFLNGLGGMLDINPVAGTGVCARWQSGKQGPVILVRGDMDALPIQEDETLPYHSEVDGVSHKCGHDGHTIILLGLAALLTEHPVDAGEVFLLFQPSEENGRGAEAVLNDPYFSNWKFDHAFALHNLPGFGKDEIVVRSGSFTATVLTVIIRLKGHTAHAAEPENGKNPSGAVAEILQFADANSIHEPGDPGFTLFTPVYATLGEKAYGTSAGYGEVHLTVRTWTAELMDVRLDALTQFLRQLESKYGLTITEERTERFFSNKNHENAVGIIRRSAEILGLSCTEPRKPFRWGEDFGLFTQRFPGAMFGLGAGGKRAALHHPDYDFNDDIISTGIMMFYTILLESTR